MFTKYAVAAAAAALIPGAASAQSAGGPMPYIGLQGGYHHFDEFDLSDFGGSDDYTVDGLIYGAYAGVHVPVGTGGLIVGAEGNFNFGNSVIDNDYGLSAHIGYNLGGGSIVFLRGGYQWVDLDIAELASELNDELGGDDDDLDEILDELDTSDDTDGDYLVGVGGDFAVGQNTALRLAVDTISFDTVRLTAGAGFRF